MNCRTGKRERSKTGLYFLCTKTVLSGKERRRVDISQAAGIKREIEALEANLSYFRRFTDVPAARFWTPRRIRRNACATLALLRREGREGAEHEREHPNLSEMRRGCDCIRATSPSGNAERDTKNRRLAKVHCNTVLPDLRRRTAPGEWGVAFQKVPQEQTKGAGQLRRCLSEEQPAHSRRRTRHPRTEVLY